MESAIDKDAKRMWAISLRYSAVGIELALGAALGYWAGSWIDDRYDTAPFGMLGLLLFGIAAGFASLVRTAREVTRRYEAEDASDEVALEELSKRQEHDEKKGSGERS
jgi:F0F1-type ATP synthase assembly protein I